MTLIFIIGLVAGLAGGLGVSKAWKRPPRPVPPKVRDLVDRLEGVEDDIEHLRERLTRLTGRKTGGEKRQDAPGRTNGPEPGVEVPPPPGDVTEVNALIRAGRGHELYRGHR